MCGEFCRRGLTIRGEGLLSIFFEKMFYGFYQPAGCGATQRWHLRYPYHHAALLRWHRGDLVGCVSTKMAGWGWRIIREIGEFQLGKHGLCESLSQGKLQEGQQKSVVKSDFFAHHVSTSPCKLVAFLCFFSCHGLCAKKNPRNSCRKAMASVQASPCSSQPTFAKATWMVFVGWFPPWSMVFWRLMGDKKHCTIFGIVFLAARMELESSLWWWSTSSLVGSIWSGNMLLPKTSSKWWNYYRILRLATVSTIVVFGQSCVHDDQMWCCEWRIQLSLGICQAVGFLVSWGIIWKAVGLEFGWSLSCL